MRIFIAFPLPEMVKQEVENIQKKLQVVDKKLPIHWTDVDKLHLTLEFLGELDEKKIQEVKVILSDIIPHFKPLQFSLTEINAFPNLNFPHVLFVGVGEKTGEGSKLHQRLVEELKTQGIETEDHEWHPHITLGRIKSHWHNTDNFFGIKFEKLAWNTNSVQLIQSARGNANHQYIALESFNFKEH